MPTARAASEPLFSVITACRNAGDCIERAMTSVRDQTCRDYQYLIIDGASTDDTLRLVERNRDLVSLCLSEPDRGISDAFNKGIARASGAYVVMVNADDWLEPDALARVAALVARGQADVYCGYQRYWERGVERSVFGADPERLPRYMSINHGASFVRRSLFARCGGFRLDYRLAMDYELFLRFYRCGATFQRVEAVLSNMDLGGRSDRAWSSALAEVWRAQRANGVPLADAMASFSFQLTKGALRRLLERLGGRRLVERYRRAVQRSVRVPSPQRPR
ncbi:MAG: glycosyltransferase [Deltaproteobacteria bacterium]|nr:glycosyltransferase [Deltaproteobacteria bacterium]